jgi:hypothetical protein
MRTRAQISRDAALRRMTNINRSLAVAAVLGTGVITDVAANTAFGHTRTRSAASTGFQPALLTSGGTATQGAAKAHRAASTHVKSPSQSQASSSSQSLQSSSAPAPAASQSSSSGSSSSQSAPVVSAAPPVTVVSGGS